MRGGKLYYDMPIGILCLSSLFPKPRGHIRNPLTFNFPTVTRVVEDIDIPRLLFNPSADLIEPFIAAARQLEEDGVQAITGSCGFMARFQSVLAQELHIPVFMSSLIQLPMLRIIHGDSVRIGILTASKSALTEAHFENAHTKMDSVYIQGMEGNPEFWETIIEGRRNDFNVEKLRMEIVETALSFSHAEDLDAIVLECTDLSAFSHDIQKETGLPVYDINSLVEYVHYAVCRKRYGV
ncbi:MAG: aspartate/glutamate racemase family protein [Mailhella sp.]|nr:aspartate/glutamate racemase family protein [Mailhella sp.]